MGQGQGSISVNQKAPIIPVPGPPFAAGSAINGLSVDPITGAIVLGDPLGLVGPADLLDDREIDLVGNQLNLTGSNSNFFFRISDNVFPPPGVFIGDGANTFGFDLNYSAPSLRMGGFLSDGYFAAFPNYTEAVGSQTEYLSLDGTVFLTQLGDAFDSGNGNKLLIDDPNQEWGIGQRTAITNLLLHKPSVGINMAFFDGAGTNLFQIGETAGGTASEMNAADLTTGLRLDQAGSGSVANLGDIAGTTTGMIVGVDVPNSDFRIQNTALNAVVVINNVNGFTGVVAPPLTITVDGGIVTNVA